MLYRNPAERDEKLCKDIWHIYHRISPSTRRSLHPTIQRMILRAVIPSYASRLAFKRKAQDPVRAFAAQSARYERRLQVVVADMIRSSWVDPHAIGGTDGTTKTDTVPVPAPSQDDYRYAMSILAHLGGTEACEAIWRELTNTLEPNAPDRATLLSYRLRALKVWMTERLDAKDWTWRRPQMAQQAPLLRSLRWRADRETRNPVQYAIAVLWDILREIGDGLPSASASTSSSSSFGSKKAYGELVVVLRRILDFLPESEASSRATLQKILQQALERGYGIDFRFLRQDPAAELSSPVLPPILDAVMYLMGSRGDVWRMTAMYESLTDYAGAAEGSSVSNNAARTAEEEDEIVETLSSALQAEAVSRESLDWLGRSRAAGQDVVQTTIDTQNATTSAIRSAGDSGVRRYEDFIQSIAPPVIATTLLKADTVATSDDDAPGIVAVQVDTISNMLRAARRSGNVELAVHLLRTVLRDASTSRNAWLGRVMRLEAITDEAPEAQPRWVTQRSLLVSASWFETVHLLARTQPHATPVATLLRTMMDAEIQAIKEEYHLLTGTTDMQESLDTLNPDAPIHRIPIAPASPHGSGRSFDARLHLQQLQRTHTDLSNLLAVSVHQVEQRRLLTAASNARRAERAAEAARLEAERVETKKAGRRKREEVHAEATLSLA